MDTMDTISRGIDMPSLMHITYQLKDHAAAVSLCGIRFTTDHAATDEAKRTGDWVSCPLCEAANLVNHLRLDTPETEPEPPQHPKRRRSPPTGWTQPAMF